MHILKCVFYSFLMNTNHHGVGVNIILGNSPQTRASNVGGREGGRNEGGLLSSCVFN